MATAQKVVYTSTNYFLYLLGTAFCIIFLCAMLYGALSGDFYFTDEEILPVIQKVDATDEGSSIVCITKTTRRIFNPSTVVAVDKDGKEKYFKVTSNVLREFKAEEF